MTKGHLFLALGVLAGLYAYESFVAGKVPSVAIPVIGSSDTLVRAATVALAIILLHKVAPVAT